MCEERDGNFYLYGNIIIRIPNPVEPSHEWVLKIFKHQDTEFYIRLFDESEEGTFEVNPVHKKVGVIIKLVPGDYKLYVFTISRVLSCHVHCRVPFSLLVTKLQQIVFR